jgi:anti-sigma factor (TIGR02949 family)
VICDDVERYLDLYLDREMGADLAAEIQDHLRTCAACRRRVAEREALGRLVRAVPYRVAPERLRARVAAQASHSGSTRRWVAWAAAAVLVASVVGGISFFRSARTPGEASLDATAEEAVSGHVRSLMAHHLFDVQSTDQHTVKPWFLGRIDFSPPVADLASIGFPLVGGRLDYLSGRPVAALVYERRRHTINLFVSPTREGATAPTARSVRGFQVHHWMRDGMSFWAVSDLNDAELSEFVHALQGE